MLRRRRVLATVKELDAFPKVPETYKEPSTAGKNLWTYMSPDGLHLGRRGFTQMNS